MPTKTRLEELDDLLKVANWRMTGGYELWCKYEGRGFSAKEKRAEQKARIEVYVSLKLEKAKLKGEVA